MKFFLVMTVLIAIVVGGAIWLTNESYERFTAQCIEHGGTTTIFPRGSALCYDNEGRLVLYSD